MHRTVELTLESLMLAAGIVGHDGTLLYSNAMQRAIWGIEGVGWRAEDYHVKYLLARNNFDYAASDVAQAIEGARVPCGHEFDILGNRWFSVTSWLPPASGWPRSMFWTQHIQPTSAERAKQVHVRDKLAVIHAVDIDEVRRLGRVIDSLSADMARRSVALAESHLNRIKGIEFDMPND